MRFGAYLRRAALVAAAAGICWLLYRQLGAWPALAVWAGATAVACVLAAVLLKGARIGEITWRNYLAGYVLPWGFALGRGKLGASTAIAWAVWVLIGASAILAFSRSHESPTPAHDSSTADVKGQPTASDGTAPTPAPTGTSTTTAVLLLITWLIHGALLLYLLNLLANAFRTSGGGGRHVVLKLTAIVLTLLAASIALYLSDRPGWALLIAGGPLALIAAAYGLFVAVILLFGKNVRWN